MTSKIPPQSFKTIEELIAYDDGVDCEFFSKVINASNRIWKNKGVTANIPTMDALRRSLALAEAILRGKLVVEAEPVTASEIKDFMGRTFPHVCRQLERGPGVIRLPFKLGRSKLTIAKPDGEHHKFECFPMRVDEKGKLVCCIQNERSGWWEDWNLEHTISGVKSGFYKVEEIPMRSDADTTGAI